MMKYLSSMKPEPGVDDDEIALENMNYTFLSALHLRNFHHHYIQQ